MGASNAAMRTARHHPQIYGATESQKPTATRLHLSAHRPVRQLPQPRPTGPIPGDSTMKSQPVTSTKNGLFFLPSSSYSERMSTWAQMPPVSRHSSLEIGALSPSRLTATSSSRRRLPRRSPRLARMRCRLARPSRASIRSDPDGRPSRRRPPPVRPDQGEVRDPPRLLGRRHFSGGRRVDQGRHRLGGARSAVTCEVCGEKGRLRGGARLSICCMAHSEGRPAVKRRSGFEKRPPVRHFSDSRRFVTCRQESDECRSW